MGKPIQGGSPPPTELRTPSTSPSPSGSPSTPVGTPSTSGNDDGDIKDPSTPDPGGIGSFTRDQIANAPPEMYPLLMQLQQKIEDKFKNHQTSEAQFRAEEAALLKSFTDVELPDY